MNKSELIDHMAESAGISKTEATKALDAFTSGITATLKGGDSVTLVGFGTFSVSDRSARNGRNPQTGETIKIAARRVPRFKAGKGFSGEVAGDAKKPAAAATKKPAAAKAAAPAAAKAAPAAKKPAAPKKK